MGWRAAGGQGRGHVQVGKGMPGLGSAARLPLEQRLLSGRKRSSYPRSGLTWGLPDLTTGRSRPSVPMCRMDGWAVGPS